MKPHFKKQKKKTGLVFMLTMPSKPELGTGGPPQGPKGHVFLAKVTMRRKRLS